MAPTHAGQFIVYSILLSASIASLIQKPLIQVPDSPLNGEFAKVVEAALERWHVPGVAIAVIDGNETWTEGYGIATYPSTPVTPRTLFYAASTTKAFVGAAVALAILSGNYCTEGVGAGSDDLASSARAGPPLAWDTPIWRVLGDDFVLADEWATRHLTLADAAGHRTGMPRHDKASQHRLRAAPGASSRGESRVARPVDVARMLRHLPLSAEPRTKFQYCNLMFTVLGLAVERLVGGGTTLGDALREWIWAPLGMEGTFFTLEGALAASALPREANDTYRLAGGYWWDEDAARFESVPFMPLDEVGGAGSIISCVEDYAKWMHAHVSAYNPRAGESGTAGSAALYAALRESHRPLTIVSDAVATASSPSPWDAGGLQVYAAGWFVTSYRGHRVLSHSGGMEAYGTQMSILPELGFGVVAMGNTAMTANAAGEGLVWRLIDEKLGVPETHRFDWDTRWHKVIDGILAHSEHAVDELYPQRADPPIAHALPLDKYAGTYYHPAYQYINLRVAESSHSNSKSTIKLVADRPDVTWKLSMEFEHVSGEYWVVYLRFAHSKNGIMDEVSPAQFKIGADGSVEALGVTWGSTPDAMVDGLIWFESVG